jgi:hypothetical protein
MPSTFVVFHRFRSCAQGGFRLKAGCLLVILCATTCFAQAPASPVPALGAAIPAIPEPQTCSLPAGAASLNLQPPAEAASTLLGLYNEQARAVRSLAARVQIVFRPGPSHPEREKYSHEIDALLFAQQPASLRLLSQAPFIGRVIFDLATDGNKFELMIPSRHEFLYGEAAGKRKLPRPMDAIRPQEVLDLFLWPELDAIAGNPAGAQESVQSGKRVYQLVVQRRNGGEPLEETIVFDSQTLRVAQIEMRGPEKNLISTVRYGEWLADSPRPGGEGACLPRHLWINHPKEDFNFEIVVGRLDVKQQIPSDRFHVQPVSGVRLINLDQTTTLQSK